MVRKVGILCGRGRKSQTNMQRECRWGKEGAGRGGRGARAGNSQNPSGGNLHAFCAGGVDKKSWGAKWKEGEQGRKVMKIVGKNSVWEGSKNIEKTSSENAGRGGREGGRE